MHDRALPPLAQAALAHYQFEAIHPFHDGNGRVGRLLITLFLIERRILPTPMLYLSAFFEATRRDYYDGLRGVSERGAWSDWLVNFLNGVARQSEDALSRAGRINELLTGWRVKAACGPTKTPVLLLDLVAANPVLTIKRAVEKFGVPFTTAQRGLERLEALEIVKEISEAQRDRVYCAEAILRILEEPANLVPKQTAQGG